MSIAPIRIVVKQNNIKSQLKGVENYTIRTVEQSIQKAGTLNLNQIKGVATRLTTILLDKLARAKSAKGGNLAGKATLDLSQRRNTHYALTSKNDRLSERLNYNVSYEYKLNMSDYGFIIGEDKFEYNPTISSAEEWIRAKISRGERFILYKYSKGKKKEETRPVSSDSDIKRLAYAIYNGNRKRPVIAIPRWYILRDGESQGKINSVLGGLKNVIEKSVIQDINKRDGR